MIKPDKYTNLELSVVNISAQVIKILKENEIVKYDEVLSMLVKSYGENVKLVYPLSVNFLFILGKLNYHNKLDAFELIT